MNTTDEPFPWREYGDDELDTEYATLVRRVREKIEFPLSFSVVGFKCTDVFFQYERMLTPGVGRPSTVEYWRRSKDKVKDFSKRLGQDLFRTVNYFNHAPSHFPLMTAAKLYLYFGASVVFDPYAGWGDRCLAAMSVGVDYIGVEKNPNLEEPFKKLKARYPSTSNVRVLTGPCEEVDFDGIDFDFVLTSPPFWKRGKMIERYNDNEVSYSDFMESFIPVMERCVMKAACVCIYMPRGMYEDTASTLGPCDVELTARFNNRSVEVIYCWNIDKGPSSLEDGPYSTL